MASRRDKPTHQHLICDPTLSVSQATPPQHHHCIKIHPPAIISHIQPFFSGAVLKNPFVVQADLPSPSSTLLSFVHPLMRAPYSDDAFSLTMGPASKDYSHSSCIPLFSSIPPSSHFDKPDPRTSTLSYAKAIQIMRSRGEHPPISLR